MVTASITYPFFFSRMRLPQMGQPAARVGDTHVCPMFDGTKPHVGGVVLPPGCPTVLIGGQPAARLGDMAQCASPAVNSIAAGSTGVLIGGQPAARVGDLMAHGGTVMTGWVTVLIGEVSLATAMIGPMATALAGALYAGFPATAAAAGALAGAASTSLPSHAAGVAAGKVTPQPENRSWFQAELTNEDNSPAANVPYRLVLSDTSERHGVTDSKGMIREGGVPPGECEFSLDDMRSDEWGSR